MPFKLVYFSGHSKYNGNCTNTDSERELAVYIDHLGHLAKNAFLEGETYSPAPGLVLSLWLVKGFSFTLFISAGIMLK
jgi:hypothetical protein